MSAHFTHGLPQLLRTNFLRRLYLSTHHHAPLDPSNNRQFQARPLVDDQDIVITLVVFRKGDIRMIRSNTEPHMTSTLAHLNSNVTLHPKALDNCTQLPGANIPWKLQEHLRLRLSLAGMKLTHAQQRLTKTWLFGNPAPFPEGSIGVSQSILGDRLEHRHLRPLYTRLTCTCQRNRIESSTGNVDRTGPAYVGFYTAGRWLIWRENRRAATGDHSDRPKPSRTIRPHHRPGRSGCPHGGRQSERPPV